MIAEFQSRIEEWQQLIDDGNIQCTIDNVSKAGNGIEILFAFQSQGVLGGDVNEKWLVIANNIIQHSLSINDVLPSFTYEHPRLKSITDSQANLMYADSPKDEAAFELDIRRVHDESEHGPFSHVYCFPDLKFGVGQIASGPLNLLKKYEVILNEYSMRPSLIFVQPALLKLSEPALMLKLDWSWDWFVESFIIARSFDARLVD